MVDLISKPQSLVSWGDVESLVTLKCPEGELIEYKEPPQIDGRPFSGMDSITGRLKKNLLREVVAFANAYGGVLVFGIQEAGSATNVAESIVSVTDCAALVDRLKSMFRDCVEPHLTSLEIFHVPREQDGDEGVIVIRTGASSSAPHRNTMDLASTIRHSDRCMTMTMREIQDLTLTRWKSTEYVEKQLLERARNFEGILGATATDCGIAGFRVTAVPIGHHTGFNRVTQGYKIAPELDLKWKDIAVLNSNAPNLQNPIGFPPQHYRPLLRGVRGDAYVQADLSLTGPYLELYCDGLLELGLILDSTFATKAFPPDWIVSIFANAVSWIDELRTQMIGTGVEYWIAAELQVVNEQEHRWLLTNDWSVSNPHADESTRQYQLAQYPALRSGRFPHYSLSRGDNLWTVVELFEGDLWNLHHETARKREYSFTGSRH